MRVFSTWLLDQTKTRTAWELTSENLRESFLNFYCLIKREQELHESWQARIYVRVFSTFIAWSNENKNCMRVDKREFMVWYGMVWYGMVWYGMVWYGMVWCVMVCCSLVCYGMLWYGKVWYDMVRLYFDMVWYGMLVLWYTSRFVIYKFNIQVAEWSLWRPLIWHGVLCCSMVWYGMVKYDMIWYGMHCV
jgi:chloride channel 2